MNKSELERRSVEWSLVRLVVAAVALFLGGEPVLYAILPIPPLYGVERILLILAWLISGATSCYLLYEWNKAGQKLFGGKAQLDAIAFFVMIISGINLGLAGVFSTNIGMMITRNHTIFSLVGVIYLLTAWHLWQKWNTMGKKIF